MLFLLMTMLTCADVKVKKNINLMPNNKKLSGLYTVENATQFLSPNMFACHVIRVMYGNIIMVYQTAPMHPAAKIIKIRIKGINTSDMTEFANTFLKKVILCSQSILYLNPEWEQGRGQMSADVFVDGQSLANMMIHKGLALARQENKKSFYQDNT